MVTATANEVRKRALFDVRDVVERVIGFAPGLAMVEPFTTLRALVSREALPKGTSLVVEDALEKLAEMVQRLNQAEDRGKRSDYRERRDTEAALREAMQGFRRAYDPDATLVRRRTRSDPDATVVRSRTRRRP